MSVSDVAARRAGLAVGSLSVALLIGGSIFVATHGTRSEIGQVLTQSVVVGGAFIAMGLLLTARAPRNPIGWCFTVAGFMWGSGAVQFWPDHLYHAGSRHLGVAARALLAGPSWPLLVAPTLQLPLLYLPDGRLRSPRWRHVLHGTIAATVAGALALTLMPGDIDGYPGVANPWAVPVPASAVPATKAVLTVVLVAAAVALFLSAVASVVDLVRRYRRSHGVVRQQLRWVRAGGLGVVIVFATGPIGTSPVLAIVSSLGFALVPVTMAVAVLRYRLYDLDRIISRTVSYAALTACVVAVYLGIAAIGGVIGGGSSITVAAATLAAAAAVRPLRRRLQHAVDRRFNRARYDADHTAERFTARLREQIAPEGVVAELVETVGRVLEPASASVWMSPGRPG